jgi:DNA repair protein RecO (recombination protein O)
MPSLKTQGIVIKRMNFGEADRILTILTERFGKVRAIAKGVRKSKSKLAGSLEPFMSLDMQLHEGKTFFIVTGAEISEEFSHIHNDLEKISRCFYIGELLDSFIEEDHKTIQVFELFLEALRSVENGGGNFWLRVFELKLIESAGFRPQFYECVHCGQKLKEDENFWDSIEGGVICRDCQKKFQHGRKVSNNLLKFFRFVENNNFENIRKLKISAQLITEADYILEHYIKSILDREIKSKSFMENLT